MKVEGGGGGGVHLHAQHKTGNKSNMVTYMPTNA